MATKPTTPRKPAAPTKSAPAPTPTKPAPAAPATFPLCGCGCGVPTVTAKARFLSGHDARFAGQVGRGEVPLPLTAAQAALVSPALQAKIDGIRETQAKRNAAKAARAAAKAAAKVAYDEAMAKV